MARPTVLIVDDEPLIRWALRQQLEADGLRILEAPNGHQALALARGEPELVLLDYRLPDASGLQVAELLLRHHPGVRVILMSAELDAPLQEAARRLGCVDCLEKPFHLQDVATRVGDVLGAAAAPSLPPAAPGL